MTLDVETSIHNKGNPFDIRNFCVSIHTKLNDGPSECRFYTDPDFKSHTQALVEKATLLVGVNIKFDIHWLRNLGIRIPNGCRIWDCMVAEFVLSGQTTSFASLDQLAEKYQLGKKHDTVADYWEKGVSTEDIPRPVVEEYGNHDVTLSYAVYLHQQRDSRLNPELRRLILLEGADLLVLSDMEWNGFKFDVHGARLRAGESKEQIRAIEDELFSLAPCPFNIDSDCLSYFLYGGTHTEPLCQSVEMVYKSGPRKGETYTRNKVVGTRETKFPGWFKPINKSELARGTDDNPLYSTAEKILLQLKATSAKQKRIVHLLLRRAELHKLVTTYLDALPALIKTMQWDGNFIHGQFNQVVARTGRLSSSKPNMQNAPEEVDEFFVSRFAS